MSSIRFTLEVLDLVFMVGFGDGEVGGDGESSPAIMGIGMGWLVVLLSSAVGAVYLSSCSSGWALDWVRVFGGFLTPASLGSLSFSRGRSHSQGHGIRHGLAGESFGGWVVRWLGFILLFCCQGNGRSCCCLGGCLCVRCALPMCISPGALLARLLFTMCFHSGCWLLGRVGAVIQSGLSGWLVVPLVVGVTHGYLMVLGWAGSRKECVCAMVYLSEVTVGVNRYRCFIGIHRRHCCMWLLPLLAPVSTVGNSRLVVVTDQGAPTIGFSFDP